MFFTKENLMSILKTNFSFGVVHDELVGDALEVDSRTAYRFCLCTNSHYLVDKYGFSLFGRYRSFNHRDLSLNPGLFDLDSKTSEASDGNLPHRIFNNYPRIFKGRKRIVFVESHDLLKSVGELYLQIGRNGANPNDYIVNMVHKNGSEWEHYFEFMASEIFLRKGYFTDIQLPWSYRGRPDFGVYRHELLHTLRSMNLIRYGAMVLELSALSVHDRDSDDKNQDDTNHQYEFIVGEVKSSQKESQILKYLVTGLCYKGYEFIPKKVQRELSCGLIRIDESNRIVIEEAPVSDYVDARKVEEDAKWFDCYLKIHLLGNLDLSEIRSLTRTHVGSSRLTFENLILLVQKKLDFTDILEVMI